MRLVPWTLLEPCAGSAALTFHLLGAKRAILPYQGSKWRFRKALAKIATERGFTGPPSQVVLTDPGPWGVTLGMVLDPKLRGELLAQLQAMSRRDPRAVYASLHRWPVPEDKVRFAAEHLYLQRLAFSGKAVGITNGRWSSPGFNKTSAYGTVATESFGAVNPMVPSLIRTLEGYQTLAEVHVDVRRQEAGLLNLTGNVVVFLDPPYEGSTRYPNGSMTRHQVVELAKAHAHRGDTVIVSEQEPLDIPGWERRRLSKGRNDTSPFRGQGEEWVTVFPRGVPA